MYFRDNGICFVNGFSFIYSNKVTKSMTIRVGSPSYLSGGSTVHVKRLIQNEKYIPTDYDFDFGLIELTEKLVYTENIKSIALPSTNDVVKDGALCTVYSWGK